MTSTPAILVLAFSYIFLLVSALSLKTELASPRELVASFVQGQGQKMAPVSRTILLSPLCSENLVYRQVATSTRVDGLGPIKDMCLSFDRDFQSDLGDVEACIGRISTVSPDTVKVQWNVTWIPPTSYWLYKLGEAWPGLDVIKTPYTHLSGKVSTFSWGAIGKMFVDALTTGKMRVPLACIEGQSRLRFADLDSRPTLVSITEELSYAQDLKRGLLLNRRCSSDLRLFLETARGVGFWLDWEERVAASLPWEQVPGSGSLDIEPDEDGPIASFIFLAVVATVVVAFANALAPELIGQSLFGPPNYIIRPESLNSFC